MSHSAISMPLRAWITAPCRPKKMLPSYMRWMSRSISNGSWPRTHSASPREILCEIGASMIAFATDGDESTSPTPTMPASVCTLTTSVSWLPSQRSLTTGRRRWMASTWVIFMVFFLPGQNLHQESFNERHPDSGGAVLDSVGGSLDGLALVGGVSCRKHRQASKLVKGVFPSRPMLGAADATD